MQKQPVVQEKLLIGGLSLDSLIICGPLAGYSCSAMRKLNWQYGTPGYCCTEMLSAHHLACGVDRSPRYVHIDEQEGAVCFQIAGKNPDIIAQAVERCEQLGAALIDLNCGCPKQKIRKKGLGSRLLEREKELNILVKTMKAHTSLPVTVKIRLAADGYGDADKMVLNAVADGGADALVVHPRSWQQDYAMPARWDDLASLVEEAPLPVIGNGDVDSIESYNDFMQTTGCAAVMISRAQMGRPWLSREISCYLKGQPFVQPTVAERGHMLLQHLESLMALVGEHLAMLQARSICKYYARDLPFQRDLMDKGCGFITWGEWKKEINNLFSSEVKFT